MHKSGSAFGALGAVVLVVAALSGVAAADASVADVPVGAHYLVSAVIVPGSGGAEVCGGNKEDGHVDFRIGFGPDQRLRINGVDVGAYDPDATYFVTVDCREIDGQWLATTHVLNQGTGASAHQDSHAMPGAADEVSATADGLAAVCVQ